MIIYKIKSYFFLHILFFLYSFIAVFGKLAAKHDIKTFAFFSFCGLIILILFVYAVLWQQILKKMTLTSAYSNKAIVVIWGMLLGNILFGEAVTIGMIIGAIIIIAGIYLVANDE